MEIMKNQEYCFCPDDGKRAMIFQCKKDAAEHIQKHLLSWPENEAWKIVLSTFDIPNTEDYVQELIRDGGITLNKRWKSEYDIVYSKMYATATSIVLTAISNAVKHQLFVKNKGITVSYSLFGVLCLIDEHDIPILTTFFLPGLGKPADHQKQNTRRQGFSGLTGQGAEPLFPDPWKKSYMTESLSRASSIFARKTTKKNIFKMVTIMLC